MLKSFCQALGIVAGVVAVDRNALNFQFVVGKSRHYFALERVNEAGTENELTYLAGFGIKRDGIRSSSRRYGRQFVGRNDRFRSHGAAAGSRTHEADQLVLGNQFGSRIAGFRRLRLIIGFHDTQFLAVYAAGFVDFINSHLAAGQCGLTVAGNVAGQLIVGADQRFPAAFVIRSFFVAATAAAACSHRCQQNPGYQNA